MRYAFRFALLAALVLTASLAATHGKAMADSCTLSSPSGQLFSIASYDPTASALGSFTIPANTISFTCTIATTSTNSKARIFFLGTSTTEGTYTAPFLAGPSASHLNFSICTTSAACGAGGPFWDASSVYIFNEFSGLKTGSNTLTISTSLAVYVPIHQDIYVGSYPARNVYFSFSCGKGNTFSPC